MAADKKKKTESKKHPSHSYKAYEIKGESLTRKNQFCPKCGVGIFLSEHKNRRACGKCGYTEFKKK
jgi:ubiquitin-small subunit ribosomal protein S27Ae